MAMSPRLTAAMPAQVSSRGSSSSSASDNAVRTESACSRSCPASPGWSRPARRTGSAAGRRPRRRAPRPARAASSASGPSPGTWRPPRRRRTSPAPAPARVPHQAAPSSRDRNRIDVAVARGGPRAQVQQPGPDHRVVRARLGPVDQVPGAGRLPGQPGRVGRRHQPAGHVRGRGREVGGPLVAGRGRAVPAAPRRALGQRSSSADSCWSGPAAADARCQARRSSSPRSPSRSASARCAARRALGAASR